MKTLSTSPSHFLRLVLVLILCSGTTIVRSGQATVQPSQKNTMPGNALPRPRVIIFDVNETLLDLAPLKSSVGQALGGREDLLPLWFSTMLHYSLVTTMTGEYDSFGEIGTAALMMVAESNQIELDYERARKAIIPQLRSLPPHEDVVAALKALRQDGYRIVSLTNSSAEGVEAQLSNAGLTDLFEKRYSVDTVKKFKPHPETYRSVLNDLGVSAAEVLMVAAHPWDLAGAKNVGLQTAFIKRPGKTLYPKARQPDYVVHDLRKLAESLPAAHADGRN